MSENKKCLDYFDPNTTIKVRYLEDEDSCAEIATEVAAGKILIVDMRGVYGFVYNPFIPDLYIKLEILKGREKDQFFNLAASYEKLLNEVVDNDRVNPDFFNLSEKICAKIIVRIPHRQLNVENIGDPNLRTVQSLSFEGIDPNLARLQKCFQAQGIHFTAGTSANLHRLPSIMYPSQAEEFAAALKLTALANHLADIDITVAHISRKQQPSIGSYPIFSFLEKDRIEIKRLINKTNYEATDKVKAYLENNFDLKSPIIYKLT